MKNQRSDINIRLAEASDAKQIAIIHITSWQKIYRGHIPDTVLDTLSIKEREGKWRELIKNSTKVLVLERDHRILGFASLCPARDKDMNPKKCGEISAIYLHPNVWHQGLGKQLCLAAISELENIGFKKVIIWVLKENHQARKFYEAIGFLETTHTKTDTYEGVALNEIRYEKALSRKIKFKPLQEVDLSLLCQWFKEEHVKEWWNDQLTDEEITAKYKNRIGSKIISPFIVYLNDKPIGFIQYYYVNKVSDCGWLEEDETTVGIDQFIGEKNLLSRGIGTKMIRGFIKYLFSKSDIKKIITEVDPNNLRAKRCYEKSGFQFIKKIMTPDGLAYLLAIEDDGINP